MRHTPKSSTNKTKEIGELPLATPSSATRSWVVFSGLLSLLIAFIWIHQNAAISEISGAQALLILLLAFALPVGFLEVVFLKTFKNPSSGLDFSSPNQFDPLRCATKYCGLVATLLLLFGAYHLFPVYQDDFYQNYLQLYEQGMALFLGVAPFYIVFVDRYMKSPYDGVWQMGRVIFLKFDQIDQLKQYGLAWLVKGFFLPLMITYAGDQLMGLMRVDFAHWNKLSAQDIWQVSFDCLMFIDVLVAAVGYLCTFRLLDAHIRSTDTTILGWVAALLCYAPFSLLQSEYLHYQTDINWQNWFDAGSIEFMVWGGLILLTITVYAWSTLMFGLRFSNLTHRGMITNGPYRWTKHPAYIAKNISWWLISMPFMWTGSLSTLIKSCLLLTLLNGVYYLRAKTEEKHLSQDPDYVAYAIYIEQHGLFAKLRQYLPNRS